MARNPLVRVRGGGAFVPKDERCRLSCCPGYKGPAKGKAVNRNPRCKDCRGPVEWPDRDGVLHGSGGRTCTSCPMCGMGLQVCIVCPGPPQEFQTDGQSMVTLGGMPDPSRFVGTYASAENEEATGDGSAGVEGLISRIDGEDANERGKASDGALLRLVARRMVETGEQAWEGLRSAHRGGDGASAARLLGLPNGAVRGPGGNYHGSPVWRVMDRLSRLDGRDWEIVRRMATGGTQEGIANTIGGPDGMTKQAVNNRLGRIVRDNPWVPNLVKSKGRNCGSYGKTAHANARSAGNYAKSKTNCQSKNR